MLVYSGCPDALFVLSARGETFHRSVWAVRDVHGVAKEFIEEHNGICAVIKLVGGGEEMWGLERIGVHLMFPGAKYGVVFKNDKFHPMRVDNIWSPHVLPYWPPLPARPICPPFADVKFWYPNLR